MQQYNDTFMSRYLLPLLGEVVTDMAKGEKNLFLKKLLVGEDLGGSDKKEFISYYFETRQDPNRRKPFSDTAPEEDRKLWNSFLSEFSKYMILRYRLSGTDGTRTAFYPDKDGRFDQERTKNIYDLAYRITLDFEHERTKALIKKEPDKNKAANDLKLLREGKLKLIVVNGVERYISEAEAASAAESKNPAVRDLEFQPVATPGLDKMESAPAAAALQSGAKISTTGEKPAPAEPVKAKSAKFGSLKDDFKATKKSAEDQKYEKIVKKLADNGLEIVPNTFKTPDGKWNVDDKGRLNGEVKDRNGQRLKVKVDPKLDAKDPKKFEFAFIGGKAPNGSLLDGIPFKLSEEDLKKFKTGDAFTAALPQLPKPVKEKPGAPPPLETAGKGLPQGVKLAGEPGMEGEGLELPKGMKIKQGMPTPPIIMPPGMPAVPRPSIPKGARIVTAGGVPGRMPPKKPKTVMGKKAALPPRYGAPAGAPNGEPGAGPAFPPGGGPEEAAAPEEEPAAPAEKKKNPWATGGIIATGAGIGGSIAAAGYVAIDSATKTPDALEKATTFIFHCLGWICKA